MACNFCQSVRRLPRAVLRAIVAAQMGGRGGATAAGEGRATEPQQPNDGHQGAHGSQGATFGKGLWAGSYAVPGPQQPDDGDPKGPQQPVTLVKRGPQQ